MDRLSQLRGGAGGSGGASPEGSAAGDSFLTASDSPSKYFSLSEDDSFDLGKDVTLSAPTPQHSLNEDCLISNLSPIGKKDMLDYKIGKQIEAANILSGGVDIFDDNENSYDGNELVIDDNVVEDKSSSLKSPESSELAFKSDDQLGESTLMEDMGGSKETEVVLQIDGKNVDAINIGNGLYLYRKEGQEELAAVQIIDDDRQQPSFKFLKVRENAEGNLEVYEEIEIEVPKERPAKEGKPVPQSTSRVPIKGINKVITDPGSSKVVEKSVNTPEKEKTLTTPKKLDPEISIDVTQAESVTELNLNGKTVKISESRKSPLMAYHSTPNKEGIPLTKTMVDQQLHPSRHSDNIKKTIEVHTENSKQRIIDTPTKSKEVISPEKSIDKPLVEDEVISKEGSVEKLPVEATIEVVPISIESKSEKVIETSNVGMNDDKKDITQEPDQVKAVSESISKKTDPIIPIENKEDQKDKDKIVVSDNLDGNVDKSAQTETVNKSNEKGIEVTASLNKPVENVIGTTTTTNMLNKSEVTEIKNPEKLEAKEITATESHETPTEIIEEMEVDENPLIIEEDDIDTQAEGPKPKENDIKLSLADHKSTIVEDQKDISRSEAKPAETLSMESKEKEFGSIDKSNSTTSETKETTAVDATTDKIEFNQDSNSKVAKDVIKTDNSLVKNSQKELDKVEIPECKQEEKDEKLNVSQPQNDSTISKPVNSVVAEAKVKHPVGTSCMPERIAPKVENIPQNTMNLEMKNKAVISDVKSTTNKGQGEINLPKNTQNIVKLGAVKPSAKPIVVSASETMKIVNLKPELAKTSLVDVKPKSINNNHTAVPFGKWTEVNRQDFLNKIKESKVPVNSSNANQLKQPHDLNRRDVLKKIDSQRQTYKVQESLQKSNVKTETAFASKTVAKQESKGPEKSQAPLVVKPKPIVIKKPVQETIIKAQPVPPAAVSSITKPESRKEINNQELIDKTIEDMINRAVTGKGTEDVKQVENQVTEIDKKPEQQVNKQTTLLDAIEIKMNELHGIPFVERPPHELPIPNAEPKLSPKKEALITQKVTNIPNLLPLSKTQQKIKDCQRDMLKNEQVQEKIVLLNSKTVPKPESSATNKDKVITEKEFDRFARRNSVTYENCLTVTDTQQVIQTVVPREAPPKKISRNEQMLAEAKAKSPHKHPAIRQYQPSRGSSKYFPSEAQGKQYHSKLQMAYQTALTAKRRNDSPITIIEDKPVKVVYMEPAAEFTNLNVQGRDLSPAKRSSDPETLTVETCDSLDSDILDAIDDIKAHEESKAKSKHQRKQVLTPVGNPDLELIEPGDLGIEVSPKKKRRTEPEKSLKSLFPKKSYLLGRSASRTENTSEPQATAIEVTQPNPVIRHNDAVSAIDNLVKAAELLENQSESMIVNTSVQSVDSSQNTPVKRGRGRPRKNPLPDAAAAVTKAPSPQKKPRLMDAKPSVSSSDESSDDEALTRENWTMGKINENIVCPICSKLFRSENVVFKHVKHCTGPSPSRSEPGRRSPRASRDGRARSPVETPRKRKSKDSAKSMSSDEAVPVEPTKPKETEKEEPKKESQKESQKTKTKLLPRNNNLVCEICGKSFRQLSYLLSHKLQHKKDEPKKAEIDKSIFSCETCKKEFRKLHHLVQHRLIHNSAPSRPSRKTSSEQKEVQKGQEGKLEDQSAGFRCEPCDKSFRKLHHLVEHRETHDGINRQRSNSVTQVNPEKLTPPPQCEICKKTFRKLHHLIEHKEQHVETSSEKSDDQKSVKSSLSTKDIIHECNLCYMVFPNEHSLTKHTVICLRKKRQSAAKQAAAKEEKTADEGNESTQEESKVEIIDDSLPMETEVVEEKTKPVPETETKTIPPTKVEVPEIKEDPPKPVKEKSVDKSSRKSTETKVASVKKVTPAPENPTPKASKTVEAPPKVKQVDEVNVIEDTPKKKVPAKERLAATVTKRQKTVTPAPAVTEQTDTPSASDDDEVRYMLNPDFKVDESVEGKTFMKVRAKKRSSLQIERPNSKDLVRRRSLLQHPPKIPRLRAKSDDTKAAPNPLKQPVKPKLEKIEQVPSTDSDDSDVKYSFPKTVPEKPRQSLKEPAVEKEKTRRKTMAERRKSLVGIAKRKSLGKAIVKAAPTPAKPAPPKRRTMAAEHRCDCGQLFSSAALLARHASLAHTPPRLRRARGGEAAPPAARPGARNPPAEPAARPSARNPPKPTDTKKKPRIDAHSRVPLPDKRPKTLKK